jgi:hypothetical protein
VIAEVVVGVTEAVQRRAFAYEIADLALQWEGLLAVVDRGVVVTEMRVTPADHVQCSRTARLVTGGRIQIECSLRIASYVTGQGCSPAIGSMAPSKRPLQDADVPTRHGSLTHPRRPRHRRRRVPSALLTCQACIAAGVAG